MRILVLRLNSSSSRIYSSILLDGHPWNFLLMKSMLLISILMTMILPITLVGSMRVNSNMLLACVLSSSMSIKKCKRRRSLATNRNWFVVSHSSLFRSVQQVGKGDPDEVVVFAYLCQLFEFMMFHILHFDSTTYGNK